jgi:hypothetical protein
VVGLYLLASRDSIRGDDAKLDVKHRVRLTIPAIPLLLTYMGEVELKSGFSLTAFWEELVAKCKKAK